MQANRKLFLTLSLVGALAGCSSMSDTERRTLSGTAIGTSGGAAIGGMASGKPLTGAAIGAAAGTASGYLYDRHKKKQGE